MEVFQLVWLIQGSIINPVVIRGINANFFLTYQLLQPIQEGFPMLPTAESISRRIFENQEKRQLSQIAVKLVEPQLGLSSWMCAAFIEPVGPSRQTRFLCPLPVILKMGIHPYS